MSSMAIGWIVFACVFGGALLGMLLRSVLPEHHLTQDSKDVVKLGMGLIATMAALVLGLLIASAKSAFDIHRKATTLAIHKAMNYQPSIDWLLDNQDKIIHKYFERGLKGEI